ncbi:hypothetical protein AAY473_011934 [Plecturocebus cupreus]
MVAKVSNPSSLGGKEELAWQDAKDVDSWKNKLKGDTSQGVHPSKPTRLLLSSSWAFLNSCSREQSSSLKRPTSSQFFRNLVGIPRKQISPFLSFPLNLSPSSRDEETLFIHVELEETSLSLSLKNSDLAS